MNYTIRQSQAIHTWPAGAIIDFPNLSLIILNHDNNTTDWGTEESNQNTINHKLNINDPRLEEAFHVKKFVAPPVDDGITNLKLSAVRFPRAQRCPKCGRIFFLNKTEGKNEDPEANRYASYDERMTAIHCPDCFNYNKIPISPRLIPIRFVIANEEGFLGDFPWDWYVHKDAPTERGKGHKLYWEAKGGSASLFDIKIISKNNQNKIIAQRTLGEIFDQKIFTKKESKHGHYLDYVQYRMTKPWKNWDEEHQNTFQKEKVRDEQNKLGNPTQEGELTDYEKRKFPRTLQRGAGNLFFPVVYSGIKLPQEAYNLECPEIVKDKIIEIQTYIPSFTEEAKHFNDTEWMNFILDNIQKNDDNVLLKLGYNKKDIEQYIKNYFKPSFEDGRLRIQSKLRLEEYKAFLKPDLIEAENEWYKKNDIDGNRYNNKIGFKLIDKTVLLEKLNVLKIYRGFTRIKPLSNEEIIFAEKKKDLSSAMEQEFQRLQDARKYPETTKELPAIEVKGEGIFIKFNEKLLNDWANNKYPASRLNIINKNIDEMNNIFGSNTQYINKRYLFLHSLSHIIMKELSEDTGYTLSSLSEIIYCDNEEEGQENMNGILIYTTTPDSEGSMGGLVEKGNPEFLSQVIQNGVDKARWCSADPLCISADKGQGFMGLNLAACYSCLLLPETSCEIMNKYLDRASIVGKLDNESIGIFGDKNH